MNYNSGDTQFTIILNNIIFGTTPTTGFYMDVTDSNPVGDVLTIQMANPTPVDPMTFVLKDGGAVVDLALAVA